MGSLVIIIAQINTHQKEDGLFLFVTAPAVPQLKVLFFVISYVLVSGTLLASPCV